MFGKNLYAPSVHFAAILFLLFGNLVAPDSSWGQETGAYQSLFSASSTTSAAVPSGLPSTTPTSVVANVLQPSTPDPQPEAVEEPCPSCDSFNPKSASAHKLMFFDNDFSYLCDPNYSGWNLGDSLKNMSLFGRPLSIGGQYRLRAHSERNMRGLGLTGVDDDFLLHRTRIYADLQLTRNLRVYGEMIDAASVEENFPARGIEVNRADMLNLFVDANLIDDGFRKISARVGRQELVLGAERLVSNLDWANTRRNFEGIRVTADNPNLTLDGFWFNPMRIDDSSFDSPDRDQEFMGLYSSFKGIQNAAVDAYWLRYLNGRGVNDFEYNTFGMRFHGNHGPTLWDLEAAYQNGENTDGSDHDAGMLTVGIGRNLQDLFWQPTLWMYYDWASGDDSLGAGNGFHHNFPLAHKYNGFMDLFGRRNLEDVNVQLALNPNNRLKLLAWYHYLFLETKSDSPYSVAMTPFNGGVAPGSADLGHEIDLIAQLRIGERRNLLLGYSHFFSGAYYDTTAGVPYSGDADFFYIQWTTNF